MQIYRETNKLETLTPDQEAICDAIADRYIAEVTMPAPLNDDHVRTWLTIVYGFYDMSVPSRVEIVDSPAVAKTLATELVGSPITSLDDCGFCDQGWIARDEAYHALGVLSDEEAVNALALRDFSRCAWDTICLDECAIVVRRPDLIEIDDAGNLHSTDGPCMRWHNGECLWAHHGTWLTERQAMSARSYSRDEYMTETNTEVRRAIGERGGWEWLREMLGGETVSTWHDPETSLTYRLISLTDGQKLIQKLSPPLADGSQPTYLEPVHEDLRTAQAARTWQATDLSVEACEADPALSYEIET